MTKVVFKLALLLIALSSCGPKLEEKQRGSVEVPNGVTFKDTVITEFADGAYADENLNPETTVQGLIKQTEFLLDISLAKPNSDFQSKAMKNYLDVEKNLIVKKINYNDSAYLDLVYKQIHSDVSSSLKDADKQITTDTDKVVALIRKDQANALKLTAESSLSEKLQSVQTFLDLLIADVKKIE